MFIRLLKWMMLAMTINVALTPWETQWAIYAGYLTIILTLVAAILNYKGKKQIELNKGTIGIIILFVAMCAGMVVDSSKLKFDIDYLKMIVSFFCFYILVNQKPQTYNAKDLNDIFKINKLLSFVYIAYTLFPFSFRYTIVNRWGNMAFTMNMGNSNATSVLVMFCIALLCIELKTETRRPRRIVNMAMILALMYTLLQLKSRTAVISMLFVIACVWIRKLNFKSWYSIIVILVPIAYFAIQILFRDVKGISFLNKELNTGRGELFWGYFNEVKNAPERYIVGSTVIHKFGNYHNAPITVISNFGLVGLVGYFIFWHYHLRGVIINTERTALQSMAVVVLFAFIIHSSAEASPMMGSIPYSSAVILLVRLTKDCFEEQPTEQERSSIMIQYME